MYFASDLSNLAKINSRTGRRLAARSSAFGRVEIYDDRSEQNAHGQDTRVIRNWRGSFPPQFTKSRHPLACSVCSASILPSRSPLIALLRPHSAHITHTPLLIVLTSQITNLLDSKKQK